MDGMDMGGHDHGSTSTGTTGSFKAVSRDLALDFWYLVVGFVGLLVLIRIANHFQSWSRLRACASQSIEFPTRPKNRLSQAWATATAIGREMSYPQLYIPTRFLKQFSPPPLGRVLVLLVYWAVVIYMAAGEDAIIKDGYFWERIGFRNAWTTMMQVPLLYLLASKASVLGYIVGSSHERLNWMHRWVARTMLVTGAVHGWHFYDQWVRADFVTDMMEMMPMVKYGFGAWGLLLWATLSSFAPLRHAWYEFFVVQHILTAVVFLWLLYEHVPASAQWYLWFAIATLCFDRFSRIVILMWQNVKLKPNRTKCKGGQRVGHQAQLRAVGGDITVVTIKDVHFKWRAGQHLYLWMPRVGPLEAHPYTIACAHQLPDTCICNSIQLIIRKHKGFSGRLHKHSIRAMEKGKKETCTVFLSGPFGAPPRWDIYETLVLISASTGASFTLPILESVLQTKRTICTKRIDFLLAARRGEEIGYYVQRLHECIDQARQGGIELRVHIAVTRGPPTPELTQEGRGVVVEQEKPGDDALISQEKGDSTGLDIESAAATGTSSRGRSGSTGSADSHVHHSTKRPDIEEFIRGPVEAAGGETSVVVCGGQSLVAAVRNCVAGLSDERAVHKGSGAQGIYLHVEEYCF